MVNRWDEVYSRDVDNCRDGHGVRDVMKWKNGRES